MIGRCQRAGFAPATTTQRSGVRFGRWNRQQFHCDFNNHAQHAFGTDHQRQQIESRGIQGAAPQYDQVAIHGRYRNTGNIVYREPVFQAVYTTGIFSNITTNGAGNLG